MVTLYKLVQVLGHSLPGRSLLRDLLALLRAVQGSDAERGTPVRSDIHLGCNGGHHSGVGDTADGRHQDSAPSGARRKGKGEKLIWILDSI